MTRQQVKRARGYTLAPHHFSHRGRSAVLLLLIIGGACASVLDLPLGERNVSETLPVLLFLLGSKVGGH